MFIASTPKFTITLPFSLLNVHEIICTFAQDDEVVVEKTKADMVIDEVNRTLVVTLSQEETLKFEAGNATCQINVLFEDGRRLPSEEEKFKVKSNLHESVMTLTDEEV